LGWSGIATIVHTVETDREADCDGASRRDGSSEILTGH
jgi:hypothetical protein